MIFPAADAELTVYHTVDLKITCTYVVLLKTIILSLLGRLFPDDSLEGKAKCCHQKPRSE